METGSCQQPYRAGEDTRGNVCSSVNRRSCRVRVPATHPSLINRSFSAGHHLSEKTRMIWKKNRKCSCLTPSVLGMKNVERTCKFFREEIGEPSSTDLRCSGCDFAGWGHEATNTVGSPGADVLITYKLPPD